MSGSSSSCSNAAPCEAMAVAATATAANVAAGPLPPSVPMPSAPPPGVAVVDIPTAVYLVNSDGHKILLSVSGAAELTSSSAAAPAEAFLARPPVAGSEDYDGGFGFGDNARVAVGSDCSDGDCDTVDDKRDRRGGSNNTNPGWQDGSGTAGRDGKCRPEQPQQQQQPKQHKDFVEIVLDEQEHRLVQVLAGTVDAYERGLLRDAGEADDNSTINSKSTNSNHPQHLQHQQCVTVRVAGGWVRDKILGKDSHDVDVAIDCMTGVQFAKLVQQYVLEVLPEQDSTSTMGMLSASRRIGVIAARPEQSKHLETATTKLCGLDVDFLNLRGQERYDTNSRIPITSFGTPLEDAMRRDFTMNSLFYNLRTRRVEDFLRRGLSDLRRGVLVTPLDALHTFRDDPLRVLRAIRFAVRYQFELDDNLREAAVHPEIHKALHVKISRERVGKELEGMLSGRMADPVLALRTLSDLQLAGSVFCLPLPGVNSVASVSGTVCGHPFCYDNWEDADSEPARNIRKLGWVEARRCLDLLPRVMETFVNEEEETKRTAESLSSSHQGVFTLIDRRLLPVATFVLPFRTLQYRHAIKQPQRDLNAVAHIMREGLKFKNADSATMTLLMESVDGMAAFLQRRRTRPNQQEVEGPSFRLEVGMMLRNLKESWVTCLLLATVVLLRESQRAQEEGSVGTAMSHSKSTDEQDWLRTARDVYRDVVMVHRLDRSWLIRPLLDGASIAVALQVPKGPIVARYLKEQVHWMLLHPDGTREACEAHLSLLHKRRQDEVRGNDAPPGRYNYDDDDEHLGVSDGTGKTPSSPVLGGRQPSERHFSKKIHVDSMDLS